MYQEQKEQISLQSIFGSNDSSNTPTPKSSKPSKSSDTQKSREMLANIVGGIVQGTLVTITGYPFDLVKTRLQTNMYRNSLSCIVQTIMNHGVLGLYRGSMMPWLSHMFKRPIQYPLAEYMKKYTTTESKSKNTIMNYLIGSATGIIGPIFGTPLQVIKVHMQTSVLYSNVNFKSVEKRINGPKNSFQYIRDNYRTNGIMGFYKGFVATLIKDTIFGGAFLGTYYTLRDFIGVNTIYKNFFNGAAAHCLTWLVFIPIDYVKSSIQKSGSDKNIRIRDVVKSTYKQHGIRGFWKGVIPACARTIPVSGTAMLGYEYVRSLILNNTDNE